MELLVYVKYRLAFFKALFGCCFVVKVSQLGFGDARKSAVPALVDSKLEVAIELVLQPDFYVLDFVQLILLVRYNVVQLLDEIHRGRPVQLFFEKLFLLLDVLSVFCALFDGVLLNWLIIFGLPLLVGGLSIMPGSRNRYGLTRLGNYGLRILHQKLVQRHQLLLPKVVLEQLAGRLFHIQILY